MNHASNLRDLTARLLSVDTTSGNPSGPAMAILAEALEARGLRVVTQEVLIRGVTQTNLLGVLGPPEPGGLLLSGHVDTVPFHHQPGWTTAPLRLTLRDDRVYGRGVSDMKAFVAQTVVAIDHLDSAQLRRPLVMAFTAEEEVGCSGAEALAPALEPLLLESLGGTPLPRLAWIGEPTSWARYHAHKGIVQCTLSAKGRGGHSSLPHRGVNAISVAARAVEAIGQLQASLRSRPADPRWQALFPEAPYTTLNVGTIRGGTAANMIPEECLVEVSYRPLPDADPLAVLRDLKTILAALDLADHAGGEGRATLGISPELTVVPGLLSSSDTPLIHALGEALEDAGGREPLRGAPYATDGGRLAPLGMDVVICGPGELDQAHQPDESLPLSAFYGGPEIIAQVARRLLC